MTDAFFREQMARLAGLRFVPAELTTHWEALYDLPEDALEAAVSRAQRTRVDFPTPIELRQDADQATARPSAIDPDPGRGSDHEPRTIIAKIDDLAERHFRITREWKYYDDACSDTGWVSVFCGSEAHPQRKPWWAVRTCDRRGDHAPHEWVFQCSCAEWNPAIKRRKERDGKYAEKPGKAA